MAIITMLLLNYLTRGSVNLIGKGREPSFRHGLGFLLSKMAQILTGILTEEDRCPKCGTKILELDPEGDIHCWGCGETFIQDHDTFMVQPNKAAIESPEPIVNPPGKVATTHKKIDLIALRVETVNHHSPESMQESTDPTQWSGYEKVACKVEEVISLYNDGYGIRPIMEKLCLAKNTVRKILEENSQLINHTAAKKLKKERVKQQRQTIITALKGIASSAKSSNHSYEWMLEHAEGILASYMKGNPVGTVQTLIGDKPFSVDDLFKKAYEIALAQRLRLDPTFIEVEEGVFKLA